MVYVILCISYLTSCTVTVEGTIILSFIVSSVLKRRSRLMLLSSCAGKFGAFLHESKLLQEGAMIAG